MADIELVIKLNEDTYNTFKNLNQIIGVLSFEKDTLALIKAIKNGVPLSKGHGDLKDVDPIIDMLQRTRTYSLQQSIDIEQFKKDLYNAKTNIKADKEEV